MIQFFPVLKKGERADFMNSYSKRALLVLWVAAMAVFVMGGGKQPPRVFLTPHEELLAAQIGFEAEILKLVKEAAPDSLHRMSGYDENGYQIVVNGLTASVPEQDTSRILGVLRRKLLPRKYLPFLIEVNEGIKTDRIGVLRGTDQYEILRVMQTNGDDYDIMNEDVIERLKEWEKLYPFEIVGAENNWVEIEFKAAPADLPSFAREVYDFCPDVVDQDLGSVEELIKDIKATKRLLLWWDR